MDILACLSSRKPKVEARHEARDGQAYLHLGKVHSKTLMVAAVLEGNEGGGILD
jgi:hypothetical protein